MLKGTICFSAYSFVYSESPIVADTTNESYVIYSKSH